MVSGHNRGEILEGGEKFYLESLKSHLEKEHTGEYVAIDVDSKKYIVDANKMSAIKRAQNDFGEKLFYIVQIGNLNEPTVNFRERKNVAWFFA